MICAVFFVVVAAIVENAKGNRKKERGTEFFVYNGRKKCLNNRW